MAYKAFSVYFWLFFPVARLTTSAIRFREQLDIGSGEMLHPLCQAG